MRLTLLLRLLGVANAVTHRVGLIHQLTTDGAPLGANYNQQACAAVLAIRHAQARNGSIIPALASIPPGHDFQSVSFDTGSVARVAIVSWRAAVAAVGVAIAGRASDGHTS